MLIKRILEQHGEILTFKNGAVYLLDGTDVSPWTLEDALNYLGYCPLQIENILNNN